MPGLFFRDTASGTWVPVSTVGAPGADGPPGADGAPGPIGPTGPAGPIDILADVDTTTTPPADGDTLVWNATLGQWIPGTPAGGGSAGGDEVVVSATEPADPAVELWISLP